MGCMCSKGVLDEYVLKKPNNSRLQLLGTSRRDDVVVELVGGNDGATEGNKENVVGSQLITLRHDGDKKHAASEESDMELAQRPKKNDVEATTGSFLQMADFSIDEMDKGNEDMLSISCAVKTLSSLQYSCGCHRLSPNELRAVMEILRYLCNEILEQQTSDRSDLKSLLVVPDDGCRLVHANTCVYTDPYGSRYVKYIDSSKLKFVHHDVSERLCSAFGIRKLSDVVVEELDYVEHLQTFEEIGYVSLAAIRQKLLSRSFQVAVSRVLNTVSSSTSGYDSPDFQILQRSLESVAQRLKFVRCIYTRFWLLPKFLDITCVSKESMIPERESGSSHRALYYVDRSNTCMLIAEPPSYVSVLDLVAVVVSHVLGSTVPLPIGSLLLCPQDSETGLANIMKLSYDERVMDIVGCGSGFLGKEVLPEDVKKAIYPRVRLFYKGEIVGWRSKKKEKLKYGRILEDVKRPVGKAPYRVNLETFPGKTETIISSYVCYFRNFKIGKKYATHVMPKDGDNVVNSMRVEQPDRSGRVKLINQGKPSKELEHGHVSAEELVQAIEEMLFGVETGMDMEKQRLLLTTLSLQELLKESQAALLLEQEKSEMATKEADTAEVALQCQICLTNEIDITVVPCGHVLCCPCSSAVSCCPICRVQLSKTIKIYRP